MTHPKLSIVVPTYNRADYLTECLQSILSQNYDPLEIIVTDDHSTDDTAKTVRDLAKRYPRIRYVLNEKYPAGPNGNKNNGLDHATGEIIGIFDDDDLMAPGALDKMIAKLEEGYDMVVGDCQILSPGKEHGRLAGLGPDCSQPLDWRDYFCGRISGEFWSVFRRDILGDRRFDTELWGGEGTLWRGIMKERKIYYLHEVVRYYRLHENDSVTDTARLHAHKVVRNYELDIELYGSDMEKMCPCYLATIHKGAAYFCKLSSRYFRGLKHLFKSIMLCPTYANAYVMLAVFFFPKKAVLRLSRLRTWYKNRKKK